MIHQNLQMVGLCASARHCQAPSTRVQPFAFPPTRSECIYFFTALLTNFAVIFKFFWISANLIAANGISGHQLNCIYLIMSRIEHLFICFRAICISLFVNHLFLLSHFSSQFLETHTLSCYLSVSDIRCKQLFPFYYLPFTLLVTYFCYANFKIFLVKFSVFSFLLLDFKSYLEKL